MNDPDTSADFFEAMFRDSADPWNFAGDSYEQFRYNKVLQTLMPGPYRYAFEPGCSVGALTEKLATVCNRVDACDFSPSAVRAAQYRCRALPGVAVRCEALSEAVDCANYDLIVLSEIGYYFSPAAWQKLVHRVVETMQPGAVLLASHWLGESPDHVTCGDNVHNLMTHRHLQHEHGDRHPDEKRGGFRLDRWRRSV